MTRPRRVEFPDAIYHVMSRGNGRQQIFHDNVDYQRMLEGLATAVTRFGWVVYCFVLMPNHLHLLLRTPEPNLSRGMQALLSGFCNWYVKRRETVGHVLQGRFKTQLVEDESYFWTVSRYIHLNPTRGHPPLVEHPRDWEWSSYRGFESPHHRLEWVAYDQLLNAWQGEMGGNEPAVAYQSFVEAGLRTPLQSPFEESHGKWVLGSQAFLNRINQLVGDQRHEPMQPSINRLRNLSLEFVLTVIAEQFDTGIEAFAHHRSSGVARDLAALLARRLTSATLRELAPYFGLSNPESMRQLIRRANRAVTHSDDLRARMCRIELSLDDRIARRLD